METNIKKIEHTCKVNGKIQSYDFCDENSNAYTANSFKYIGYGAIHTVNNVPQIFHTQFHFWVKKGDV